MKIIFSFSRSLTAAPQHSDHQRSDTVMCFNQPVLQDHFTKLKLSSQTLHTERT